MYKILNKGLIPGIYSLVTFGYIGIPTNIQEMIRHQLPISFRVQLLDWLTLEQWFTFLFISAFLAAVWGGIGTHLTSVLIKKTYHRIVSENEVLKQRQASKAINCYELFSRYLYNNYFSKLGLTVDERVSLYKLDMELFLCTGRYSENEVYCQKPDRLYPKIQGCIAKVWQTGKFQHVIPYDPETHRDEWITYNIETFDFDEETAKSIKMKSQAYLGFRIKNANQKTVAVLIFESMNSNGLKFSKIISTVNERELQNLCHLLESLDNHMPSLQAANSEGF